jgi:hypothetical protein
MEASPASETSSRHTGLCRRTLPTPHTFGEQLCAGCRSVRKRHRVYMSFMHRDEWLCQFLEEDLKTPLPRKVTFSSPEKVREMAARCGCDLSLDTRHALDHGIEVGRGGVWLELSDEQYQKLQERR